MVRWLYTGDYDSPYPIKDEAQAFGWRPDTKALYRERSDNFALEANNRKGVTFKQLRELVPTAPHHEAIAFVHEQWCQHVKAKDELSPSDYDFGSALMCHAEVYAIANYTMLQKLKDLAFQRLATLLLFLYDHEFDETTTSAIMNLARYVYENTESGYTPDKAGDGNKRPERLRHFVSSFIAGNILNLNSTEVDTLVAEGEDCTVDVMGKLRELAKRMHQSQGSI